ncbi:hypothetical protein SAY87_011245 [Trapa incisa]|uniref:Uncharacterized protein n=1 Tax=Trapa incisa TaxID=236973 RepID=A0AAN7GQK4_9MYRT|nr:hypothetical protein SAY87_011245 [Trapa incisa]
MESSMKSIAVSEQSSWDVTELIQQDAEPRSNVGRRMAIGLGQKRMEDIRRWITWIEQGRAVVAGKDTVDRAADEATEKRTNGETAAATSVGEGQ